MMNIGDRINYKFWFPKYLGLTGLIVGSLAFGVASISSNTSLPFFAALFAATVTMLIGATWPWRGRKLLWFLWTANAALHLALLLYIPFPKKVSYGITFAPLVFVDILISWQLIVMVLKLADTSRR